MFIIGIPAGDRGDFFLARREVVSKKRVNVFPVSVTSHWCVSRSTSYPAD